MSFVDQKFSFAFTSSGTTAVTAAVPDYVGGLILGAKIKAHTYSPVGAGASGASGGVVKVVDPDGDTILTFAEVATGATTVAGLVETASGGLLLVPGSYIQYDVSPKAIDNRCVSGGGVPTSQYPTASVTLYLEQNKR